MQRDKTHYLAHAGIYLLARGLPGLVAFLAIPLFSRLLAPADYGRYAMVVATVGLLNALLFQWLRLSLVRYMPAYRDEPQRIKSTLVTVALLLIVAAGLLVAIACAMPIGPSWRGILVACWVMLTVQSLFELCSEYARATVRPWRNMTLQVMRAAAFVGVGTALVLLGWRWWGPLAGLTAGMLLAVILSYRQDWRDVRLTVDRAVLAKLTRYGVPLSVTVALAVVVATSDRFMIDLYLGDDAAGLYSVAVDFTTQSLTLLMMVINLAMFPLAVRAWEEHGPAAAQEQMRNNASMLMAVGLPCVVGMTILAPGIAHCFLGEQFRAAAVDIIPLVALGAFLAGLKAYHFDAAFQFADRTIHQVWIVLFVAVLNVGLNVIAIPRWGINGSACASLGAYAVSIGLTAWLGRRYLVLPFPIGACARVMLASGAMGLAIWQFRDATSPLALGLQIVGGAAVYACVLLACDFLGLRKLARERWRARAVRSAGNPGAEPAMRSTLLETR